MKTIGIYLDIDSLLDTRLSTLYIHKGQDFVSKILSDKKQYLERKSDAFEGVNKAQFSAMYEKRNKATLAQAGRTKIIVILKAILLGILASQSTSAIISKPKIYLNTYPYELTQDEQILFLKLLIELTDKKCDIELIDKSPQKLSLSWVKNHLNVLFMYSYSDWLDAHAKSFEEYKMPDVELYCPALYFGSLPTREDLQEIELTKKDPFELMELGSCIFIGIKFVDPAFFSLNLQ